MERRALVKALMIGVPAAAAVAAGAAVRSTHYVKDASEQSMLKLKNGLDELKERVDQMEASNKKWLKAAFAVAAVSLGIDLSALL